MQSQCISKIVIYNTGVQCNPVFIRALSIQKGWMTSKFNDNALLSALLTGEGTKNVARDARYISKRELELEKVKKVCELAAVSR